MKVRDAVAADHAAILALNNGAVPHVNALSVEDLAWLSGHAIFFRVVEDAVGVLGFALVLPSGGDYWSDNYKWFAARYDRFVYLDRVVIADRARRRGAGRECSRQGAEQQGQVVHRRSVGRGCGSGRSVRAFVGGRDRSN